MSRLALLVALLASFAAPPAAAMPGEVLVGATLREANMYGFAGDFRRLSEYRGKPLLINVWASWCGPCRLEMGSLERLARRIGGRQFNIVGVSTDDDAGAALRFILQSGVTFDNYHDQKLTLENMLGASAIPLTVLVDAKGRVVLKVHGTRDWDSPESLALIAKALQVRI
jgi:thiol-disulfide isomerase/thioredoxin